MTYNSTIIPKNKKCKCGCGRSGRLWSKGMLKECYFRENPPKPIAKFSKKRESELEGVQGESMQNLVNDLDRLFSLVVRLSFCNKEGFSTCFVCEKSDHYKNMQNSHYIKRGNMGLRFNQFNCHNSCSFCNEQHNHNEEPYRLAILKEHGKDILDYLEENRHTIHKWTIGELKEMRIYFQNKYDVLMTKFNN